MRTRIRQTLIIGAGVVAVAAMTLITQGSGTATTSPRDEKVKRGAYLVNLGGCNDCHSAKAMTAKGPVPDPATLLCGHLENDQLPAAPDHLFGPGGWGGMCNLNMTAWVGPWGVSFASNLTPDNATGIGAWTEAAFIKAMRTGKHLGSGRDILPPMPWPALGQCTDQDLGAIFVYLKSLKPIKNQVPLPVPPKQ